MDSSSASTSILSSTYASTFLVYLSLIASSFAVMGWFMGGTEVPETARGSNVESQFFRGDWIMPRRASILVPRCVFTTLAEAGFPALFGLVAGPVMRRGESEGTSEGVSVFASFAALLFVPCVAYLLVPCPRAYSCFEPWQDLRLAQLPNQYRRSSAYDYRHHPLLARFQVPP